MQDLNGHLGGPISGPCARLNAPVLFDARDNDRGTSGRESAPRAWSVESQIVLRVILGCRRRLATPQRCTVGFAAAERAGGPSTLMDRRAPFLSHTAQTTVADTRRLSF